MMRRLAEVSGEKMTPTMEEMFRRWRPGRTPTRSRRSSGPQLEAEMGDEEGRRGSGRPTRDDGLYNL